VIVIDASAMVEALIGQDADAELLDGLAAAVHAPHLLDVEVLSVLRGLTIGGKLKRDAAEAGREDYFEFTIDRREAQPLADRVWELRHRFTTYDACYLALAEALSVPLYTCDHELGNGGHNAEVKVFPRTLTQAHRHKRFAAVSLEPPTCGWTSCTAFSRRPSSGREDTWGGGERRVGFPAPPYVVV
jgi:predicted nucleic acid-binding protein